jgi:hypothetical protein
MLKMSSKIYPGGLDSPSSPVEIQEGEKDLFMFMRNAYEYFEEKTSVAIRNRKVDDTSALFLTHPGMLTWKARMLPFFMEWVIYKNHKFMDKKGYWKNDTGSIKSRWCELEICGRKCLVDFKSRSYDGEEAFWKTSMKSYDYTFIIDPYYYDTTDDNWLVDCVH